MLKILLVLCRNRSIYTENSLSKHIPIIIYDSGGAIVLWIISRIASHYENSIEAKKVQVKSAYFTKSRSAIYLNADGIRVKII
jgi:hypothetical protein